MAGLVFLDIAMPEMDGILMRYLNLAAQQSAGYKFCLICRPLSVTISMYFCVLACCACPRSKPWE